MVEYVHLEREKGPKIIKVNKYTFSTIEIKHLLIALVMIILTIYVHQFSLKALLNVFTDVKVLIIFMMYVFTIGLGFLLHELGHKLVAQHYGFMSEFRADFNMLIFMFLFAVISPVILLAPGAVLIHGRLSRRQNGIVSVAGPLVNLVLAIIFILLKFILNPVTGTIFATTISLGIFVNAFLGIFNMLPFWVLDGKKVLAWNKPVYFSVMGALIFILVVFGF